MATDLTSAGLHEAWRVAEVPEIELADLLGRYFGGCREDAANAIVYPREGTPSVTLTYRRDALTQVVPGPALTQSDVAKIGEEIARNLIGDGGTIVCRNILFSAMPVTGWWRHDDSEQIMPVATDAPKANQLVAPHPFVLEFRIRDSIDRSTMISRRTRRVTELARVLSVLLEGGVRLPDQGYYWVVEPGEKGGPGSIDLRQAYYWPDNMITTAPELSRVDEFKPIDEVERREYFERYGIAARPLDVTSSFGDYLDQYDLLVETERAIFDRACHWFSVASMPGASLSASLVALISAVEALEPDDALPRCECCQAVTGVTKRFREFIELYAPMERQEDSKVASLLYDIRSRLSHGSLLLRPDWESRGGSLHPLAIQHRFDASNALRLVRTVLVNWLSSHDPTKLSPSDYLRFRAFRGKSFAVTGTLGTTPTALI